MDAIMYDTHSQALEMAEKMPATTLSFLGRRSFVPRPLSEATLIMDTDDEDDDSLPSSLMPDNDSQSSLSSPDELKTPSTAGLGGFEFHLDNTPIKGPVGPHLFRASSVDHEEIRRLSPSPESKPAPRRFTHLGAAVAQLDQTKVRDWSPSQVADWMAGAGFDQQVVEKFRIHDIYGSVLLDMQTEDLKEIEIDTYGKRKKVMSSIQELRNSSMISITKTFTPSSSPQHSSRSVSRSVKPEESFMVAQPKKSRRGRSHKRHDDISPAESISIVAIEQLLPEPHNCTRGERCSKWRKYQRQIQKINAEFEEDVETSSEAKSVAEPSIVGSSDVFGPAAMPITAELLNEVQPRDPQENVRHFLDFQHMHSPHTSGPSPPPAPSARYTSKSAMNQHLSGLPRLQIPSTTEASSSPDRTPISALRNPTKVQADSKRALLNDPYHYGGVASPVDVYRVATPMSVTDLPVTALPEDPCHRDVSQSVPPEMRYGEQSSFLTEPIARSTSTLPSRRRQPSFMPVVSVVQESEAKTVQPPVVTNEAELAAHAGWMRKRKTTRLVKHEWQDHYFNLNGTKLDMRDDDSPDAQILNTIDVDEYALHVYSAASGSKLQAAFKKTLGAQGKEPSFAFTLIPEDQLSKKMFEKDRSHHFAVNSGRDRVEWMRKLMLAKAMKKNDETNRI